MNRDMSVVCPHGVAEIDCDVCGIVNPEQVVTLLQGELREVVSVLRALNSNKHVNLGDLVYKIRDVELEGWEGHWVTQWSNTVVRCDELLAKYPLPSQPPMGEDFQI